MTPPRRSFVAARLIERRETVNSAGQGPTKENAPNGGHSMGGTGLEPVTPCLSRSCRRSRPFAPVRLDRFVERNHLLERTFERTRANAEPCHPCHARRQLTHVIVAPRTSN